MHIIQVILGKKNLFQNNFGSNYCINQFILDSGLSGHAYSLIMNGPQVCKISPIGMLCVLVLTACQVDLLTACYPSNLLA